MSLYHFTGVEIHEDVIQHCQESIKNWKNARAKSACGKRQAGSMTSNPEKFCPPHIEILHGNGLNISSTSGESVVGFDRIYIGASVDSIDVMELKQLLSPGGILVGPGKNMSLIYSYKIKYLPSNANCIIEKLVFFQLMMSL